MESRKTLTLKAGQGQDEANYGTEKYPVNLITHEVEVPEEAAPGLLGVGGFELVTTPAPVPAGMVRVKHPDGVGCSFGGVSYEPSEDGSVTVPAVAVAALMAHGFVGIEGGSEPEAQA